MLFFCSVILVETGGNGGETVVKEKGIISAAGMFVTIYQLQSVRVIF